MMMGREHAGKNRGGEDAMAVIGIDLGTTNSLAGIYRNGHTELIPNAFGEYLTPSVVSIGPEGEIYVGKIAQEMRITNPSCTFLEFKRDMGTDRQYRAGNRSYRAEELSSFVLRRLKEDAEHYLGEPVTEAVISVPAYFDDDKRCATRNAARLAGLKAERLINEPSAVALKHHGMSDVMETFIVFDLGGGTLDVSLVEAFDNMVEIRAVAGDNYLGGKDFNEVIARAFYEKNGLSADQFSAGEQGIVLREAERLKRMLSESNEARRTVRLGDRDYVMEMTSQELVHRAARLLGRMSEPIRKVLNDSRMSPEDADCVILTGGSSRMPVVREYIKSICKEKTRVEPDDAPEESIVTGVAMAAAIRERTGDLKDVILSDICPFSLGVELYDGTFSPIIERNDTLPCSRTKTYYTYQDRQTALEFQVYQGESLIAAENLFLGSVLIDGIPPAPRGKEGASATFLYDINGILDIRIKNRGHTVHRVMLNRRMGLSDEELAARLSQLEKQSLHPSGKERYRLLAERAKRLYMETGAQTRERIAWQLRLFEEQLATGSAKQIRAAYVRLLLLCEQIEGNQITFGEFDESFWEEKD